MINLGFNMQDRRSCPRWQVNRLAKIKLDGAQTYANCNVLDLSLKGVRIFLRLKLPQDTYLKLILSLSSELNIPLEAWVVWHKQVEGRNLYGLYFTRITDADKEKIYRFCRAVCGKDIFCNSGQPRKKAEGGERMSSEGFTDKRVFERFLAKFPVRYLNTSANQEGKGKTLDVSAKGLGLVTQEEIPVNSSLELWLEIPDGGEPLYARGEVIWSKRTGLSDCRSGINLEKADLMGLSRVLRMI